MLSGLIPGAASPVIYLKETPEKINMDLQALVRAVQSAIKEIRSTADEKKALVTQYLISLGVPGSVAAVIAELVVGVVMLFVGLFMIDAVFTATAINNTSTFYGISTALVTTTGTIFSVLGLVIIVIALATAIGSLKAMT